MYQKNKKQSTPPNPPSADWQFQQRKDGDQLFLDVTILFYRWELPKKEEIKVFDGVEVVSFIVNNNDLLKNQGRFFSNGSGEFVYSIQLEDRPHTINFAVGFKWSNQTCWSRDKFIVGQKAKPAKKCSLLDVYERVEKNFDNKFLAKFWLGHFERWLKHTCKKDAVIYNLELLDVDKAALLVVQIAKKVKASDFSSQDAFAEQNNLLEENSNGK
ncbi:hypothetical protein A3B87_01270 [Candidatus Kuenenbacteria bacterium RIFCSPHIGHO2_02_FULL_39_13]|uniref:Uncharacterized protein n=1 Tax=Candidatus Kuenenbacteria bacterium RIFCSPHIGHO2_02_FULL_39_13 TaxID=1798561 RepID=A0A1F6FLY2_9BACT|nr:MAG: hypothetical protein A3B87_01270 [Candidatus Kuenenbacteria bacterium RIFCSPHIGHO2_02_FULL_39_13]